MNESNTLVNRNAKSFLLALLLLTIGLMADDEDEAVPGRTVVALVETPLFVGFRTSPSHIFDSRASTIRSNPNFSLAATCFAGAGAGAS